MADRYKVYTGCHNGERPFYYFMKTIYKYPIKITDRQYIVMPFGGRALKVGLDPQGQPYIWALVDTTQSEAKYHLAMYGTGHECLAPADDYFDSFNQGSFVWHVFMR